MAPRIGERGCRDYGPATVVGTLRPPDPVAAKLREHQNQGMVDQIGAHAGGIHLCADSVLLKLGTRPNSGTHQDGWRCDGAGGERDAFNLSNVYRHVAARKAGRRLELEGVTIQYYT